MPEPIHRCLCCTRLFTGDECPQRMLTPHSQEILASIICFMVKEGWHPSQRIPEKLHREAIAQVVAYNEKFAMPQADKNVLEFLKLIEQK